MKYKAVFFLFTGVFVLSFLLIFLFPFFIISPQKIFELWGKYWIFLVPFCLLLLTLETLLITRRKVSDLVERKDWSALFSYLEKRIYTHHRTPRLSELRLAIATATILEKLDWINQLERYLRRNHNKILPRVALSLGIPYITNLGEPAEIFFGEFKNNSESWFREWLLLFYALAVLSQQKHTLAKEALQQMASLTKEPSLQLLRLHLLFPLSSPQERHLLRDQVASILRVVPSEEAWKAYLLDKRKENLFFIYLTRPFTRSYIWAHKLLS